MADGLTELKLPAQAGRNSVTAAGKRASPGLSPDEVPKPGPEARLINISRCGIRFESAEHMIPGGIVYLRLVAADAVFWLKGKVLRSRPALLRKLAPTFESAVSFDGTFPTPVGTHLTPGTVDTEAYLQAEPESGRHKATCQATAKGAPLPPTYTVTARVPRTGPDLNQIFGLNRW